MHNASSAFLNIFSGLDNLCHLQTPSQFSQEQAQVLHQHKFFWGKWGSLWMSAWIFGWAKANRAIWELSFREQGACSCICLGEVLIRYIGKCYIYNPHIGTFSYSCSIMVGRLLTYVRLNNDIHYQQLRLKRIYMIIWLKFDITMGTTVQRILYCQWNLRERFTIESNGKAFP